MTYEESAKQCIEEWIDKTSWVQDTAHWSELGMHRADVIKQRIDQKDVKIEEYKEALGNLLSTWDSICSAYGWDRNHMEAAKTARSLLKELNNES